MNDFPMPKDDGRKLFAAVEKAVKEAIKPYRDDIRAFSGQPLTIGVDIDDDNYVKIELSELHQVKRVFVCFTDSEVKASNQ